MATFIYDVNDLQDISLDLAGDYKLANDIDASGGPFTPLGTFTGTLDCRNYTIDGLTITINAAGDQTGALFTVNQGTIKNGNFTNCAISVTSTNNQAKAACIAYNNDGGTIQNCSVSGTISATCPETWGWATAGSIARINGGIITGCGSTATITATSAGNAGAGGLIYNGGGNVSESYASGNVIATTSYAGANARYVYAGGLVGVNAGAINDCYARGNATATETGGGGSVASYASGLVAWNDVAGTIDDSYSTGVPTATDTIGGLCATDDGTITNCFWDETTSGTAVSDGGTGKTTSQMKTKSTFTDADWDFIVIWFINGITNDGYPFHFAMPPEPTPDAPRETVDIEDKITLECVRNVEMAAGGRFRIDKEGKAVYRSRYARNA